MDYAYSPAASYQNYSSVEAQPHRYQRYSDSNQEYYQDSVKLEPYDQSSPLGMNAAHTYQPFTPNPYASYEYSAPIAPQPRRSSSGYTGRHVSPQSHGTDSYSDYRDSESSHSVSSSRHSHLASYYPSTSRRHSSSTSPPISRSYHRSQAHPGYIPQLESQGLYTMNDTSPITSPSISETLPAERFPCDKCGKSFSRAHDRKRHYEGRHVAHSSVHKCRHCLKEFSRADSLKRHTDNGCEALA